MNLDRRSAVRGSMKVAVCRSLGLAAFQWVDCKVVNCVSSFLEFGVSEVKRQVGRNQTTFECPSALAHYQQHMGGVDKSDQMRSHFGGFASQSHFKKWYKKALMAVIDCMLLNGLQLWNLSTEKQPERERLSRSAYMHAVAFELMHFKTECLVSPQRPTVLFPGVDGPSQGQGTEGEREKANKEGEVEVLQPFVSSIIVPTIGQRCMVCQLSTSQMRGALLRWKKNSPLSGPEKERHNAVTKQAENMLRASYSGIREHVCRCNCMPDCVGILHQHVLKKEKEKMIHNFFPGMNCMEIYHSNVGKQIWKSERSGSKKVRVSWKHPVVEAMRIKIEEEMFGEEVVRI
jgi:hypothetical protein